MKTTITTFCSANRRELPPGLMARCRYLQCLQCPNPKQDRSLTRVLGHRSPMGKGRLAHRLRPRIRAKARARPQDRQHLPFPPSQLPPIVHLLVPAALLSLARPRCSCSERQAPSRKARKVMAAVAQRRYRGLTRAGERRALWQVAGVGLAVQYQTIVWRGQLGGVPVLLLGQVLRPPLPHHRQGQ